MSDQALVIVDKLFEGDQTERGKKYRDELVEAYNNYLEDPSKRLKKVTLTSVWFKTMGHILKKRIPKNDSYIIQLTPTELNFIDYGYLFPDLCQLSQEEVEANLQSINWNTGSAQYLKFYSFTGYLNHEFHRFMGYFELQELDHEIENVKIEFENLENEKREFLQQINQLNEENYATGPKARFYQVITTMNNNLYRLTEALLTMKKRVQSGQALTAEERTQLLNIEDKQKQLQRERNNLYKESDLEHKIYQDVNRLEDKYFKKIDESRDKFFEIRRQQKRREEFAEAKLNTPINLKEEFIAEKVKELQNLIDYTSKRSKVVAFPFLTGRILANIPEKIKEAVRNCEKFDQTLFKHKGVRLNGMPGVIIGPGNGEGFYNYENNMLFLPLDFSNNLEESVIHAIIVYKWDMDESREMRDSFAELRPYKGKSYVELQKGLFKEYLTYVTRECRGYKVMDKEIKEWFTWKIAPSKEDLENFGNTENLPENDESLAAGRLEGEVIDIDDPNESSELAESEEETPPTCLAEQNLRDFYKRLYKVLPWPNLKERIQISRSQESGDIDITIRNIDLTDMEPEEIFQGLLIQSKLRRYSGLEKSCWDKKPE